MGNNSTVSSSSDNVTLLLGNGLGGFTVGPSFAVGRSPQDIVSGNLDSNTRADLVVTNSLSSSVSVLLGDGSANFSVTSFEVHSNQDNSPRDIEIGDFNNDFIMDIAITSGRGTLSDELILLLGNQGLGFISTESISISLSTLGLATGDLNGDNHQDLVMPNLQSVTVLLGNGTGLFTTSRFQILDQFLLLNPEVGDLNGDRALDIVVMALANEGDSDGDSLFVLLDTGSGDFNVLSPIPLNVQFGIQADNSREFGQSDTIDIGDFNNDGQMDIVTANKGSGNISLLLGRRP